METIDLLNRTQQTEYSANLYLHDRKYRDKDNEERYFYGGVLFAPHMYFLYDEELKRYYSPSSNHTLIQWKSVLNECKISLPDVEQFSVDIPGRNGIVDLSEVLAGHPVYKTRELTVVLTKMCFGREWKQFVKEVSDFLHGKVMYIMPDSIMGAFYKGRCVVTADRIDQIHGTVTITAVCDPFRWTCKAGDPVEYELGGL